MLHSCIVECWIGIVGCVSEWMLVNDKICLWSDLLYSVVEKELKDVQAPSNSNSYKNIYFTYSPSLKVFHLHSLL